MSNKQFHGQINTVSEAVQAIGELDPANRGSRSALLDITYRTGQVISEDLERPTFQRLLNACICVGFDRRDMVDTIDNYLTQGMATPLGITA